MGKAQEVRSQPMDIMKAEKMEIVSCGTDWDVVRNLHTFIKLQELRELENMLIVVRACLVTFTQQVHYMYLVILLHTG